MSVTFESYERRIDKIRKVLKQYGIKDLEEARKICLDKGIDCEAIVKGIQPIAFENAVWAYTVGCAIAIKKGCKVAADAAEALALTAPRLAELGIVDGTITSSGTHRELAERIIDRVTHELAELASLKSDALVEARQAKFRAM